MDARSDVLVRAARVAGQVPALSLRGVSKTFDRTTVLHDFDLDIMPGEIHALMGQNGSGKSTTVKLLSGFFSPDPGAMAEVRGLSFDLGSPTAAVAAGLRFVHQNLGLVDDLSVRDNFRMGPNDSLRPVRARDEVRRVVEALDRIGFGRIDPALPVSFLAAPERTALAIARALDHVEHVPLLVLDEPTASLPRTDARALFEAMRAVAANGTAILYISHHLDEVLALSDRVSVLRDGRLVAREDTASLDQDQLVEHMLGRRLVHDAEVSEHVPVQAEIVLEARHLQGSVVENLSLTLQRGEVLGITGLVGSGREEVAGLLSGRLPRNGSLELEGSLIDPGDPAHAIRAGLCTVPVDRAAHALITDGSVRENLTISGLREFWRRCRLAGAAERRHVRGWIAKLEVQPVDPERPVTELSGGNQQKVVVGRWLRVSPTVLVLEEPTQGVDIGSKADLHNWIDSIAQSGTSVVLCSSDAAELARLATRILVMQDGRVSTELRGAQITADAIEHAQLTATAHGRTHHD